MKDTTTLIESAIKSLLDKYDTTWYTDTDNIDQNKMGADYDLYCKLCDASNSSQHDGMQIYVYNIGTYDNSIDAAKYEGLYPITYENLTIENLELHLAMVEGAKNALCCAGSQSDYEFVVCNSNGRNPFTMQQYKNYLTTGKI